MLTVKNICGKFDKNTPCVLLLGGFDGLHGGHLALLERAKSFALPVGFTVIGGNKGKDLFTLCEREEIFSAFGVDFILETDFQKIKDVGKEEFVEYLSQNVNVYAFVCGKDFRFGKGAEGTPEFLRQKSGCQVVCVPTVLDVNGEKTATSRIKSLLADGNVSEANALLSYPFFLKGQVIKDRGVGAKLGFPTANLIYPNDKFPLKNGVYETQTSIDGKNFKGITNIGARPTFSEARERTETHLIGFSGNLYGKTLKVEFLRFLREIKKFDDVEDLIKQLTDDKRRVLYD